MPGLYNKSSHSLHTFGKIPSPSLDEMLSVNNNTEVDPNLNLLNQQGNDRRKALYYYGDISTESIFDSRIMDIEFVDDAIADNEQDKSHAGHFSNCNRSVNPINVDNVCGNLSRNLLINMTESFDHDV